MKLHSITAILLILSLQSERVFNSADNNFPDYDDSTRVTAIPTSYSLNDSEATTVLENSLKSTDYSTEDTKEIVTTEGSEIASSSVKLAMKYSILDGKLKTECNVSTTTFQLTKNNELTIFWNITDAQKTCTENFMRIELTIINCTTTDCITILDNVRVSKLSQTVNGELEACGTYIYKIYQYDVDPNNPVAQNEFTANERFEKIEIAVSQINGDTSVFIAWNYYLYSRCSRRFFVEVSWGRGIKSSFETIEITATIEDLEPCETYNITVQPITSNSEQALYGSTKTYVMREVIPHPVTNLSALYNENDAAIETYWKEPQFGDKCVKNYAVNFESDVDNRTRNPTSTTEKLPNVFACVLYTIRVTTITLSGNNVNGVTKEFNTPSRVFNRPTPPKITVNSWNSAKLSTSVSEANKENNCKVNRVEFRCISADSQLIEVEIFNKERPGLNPDNITIVIDKFNAFTTYSCSVRVENGSDTSISNPSKNSYSMYSYESTMETWQGIPDAPAVTVINEGITSSSCPFKWDEPKDLKGNLESYNIRIIFLGFEYFYPDYCQKYEEDYLQALLTDKGREYTYAFALPHATYSIQVQAKNQENYGSYSQPEICETLPAPSEPVIDFEVIQTQPKLNEPYNKTTKMAWKFPCKSNGRIEKFVITCQQLNSFNKMAYEIEMSNKKTQFSISIYDLEPDTGYNTTISAFFGDIKGKTIHKLHHVPAGLPELIHWESAPLHVDILTKSAKILFSKSIFNSNVGKITKIIVLLAELGCGVEIVAKTDFIQNDIKSRTWMEVQNESCIPQYQTGSMFEADITLQPKADFEDENFIFPIGISSCETNNYCNGPLKPGTLYALTLRFYTSTGFTDSDYIEIRTEKEIQLLTILLSCLLVLSVAFIVGFYISFKRTKALREPSTDSPFDAKDISVSDFMTYYNMMTLNDKEKIKDEYSTIQTFSDNLENTCIASRANEKLNRYINISPFDYNRVVLNDDEFENDYINASYVNGYHYPREYIASQGPKPNTCHDFWRMALQHKCESIVMLTSLVESDKVKCHEYFPKLKGQMCFENISIVCTMEQVYQAYTKRILEIQKDDLKHSVAHYYFKKWPDHSSPSSPSDLIDFSRLFRSERQKPGGTIIVHCSAGVGRTGTFIALDIIMQRIKQERKINIFELVKQLRLQRMKMVQTLDQYNFLYVCTMELSERKSQPKVFQSMTPYIEDLKLFSRWRKKTKTAKHDKNGNILKADNSENSL